MNWSKSVRTTLESPLVVTVLTALLSYCGYAYLDGYYGFFGLDLQTLDLPVYSTFIWSLQALVLLLSRFGRFFWVLLFLLAIPIYTPFLQASFLLRKWFPRRMNEGLVDRDRNVQMVEAPSVHSPVSDLRFPWRQLLTHTAFVVVPVLATVGIVTLGWLAYKEGCRQAETDYRQPAQMIKFDFKKEDVASMDSDLVMANSEHTLRLLVQTKDLIVVYVVQGSHTPRNGVIIVSRGATSAVHNIPARLFRRL